jgi:hypothetical protein
MSYYFLNTNSNYVKTEESRVAEKVSGGGWDHEKISPILSSGTGQHVCRFKVKASSPTTARMLCGIIRDDQGAGGTGYIGEHLYSYGFYSLDGYIYNNQGQTPFGSAYYVDDVIDIIYDSDNGTLSFIINDIHQGTAFTGITGDYYFGLAGYYIGWKCELIILSNIINSGLNQAWRHNVSSPLFALWGQAPTLSAPLNIYWRYARNLQAAVNQLWDDAPVLQGGLLQSWRLFGAISSGIDQRWSALQGAIQSGIIQQWAVKSTSPLASAINQFWDSPQAGAVLANIIFYVEIGGVAIQSVTDCQAGLNINEAFNTATITISSRVEFGAIALGHPVTIVQFGVEFKYFVAGRDSGWAVSGAGDSGSQKYTEEFVIRCESITAALHRPHAADLNQDWPAGGSAEQIISDLASVENITVDFQADDFLVPPNFLKAENNTPWEVIQKITGPLRLAEQTLPDGTLVIRESFPDRPGDWETTQPFYLLSADGGFNKYTEQFNDDQVLYNMVTVADTLESQASDSLTIESEDISSSQKRIRVWEVPWVGEFALEHSGDDSVSIIKEGVVQEELTYLAEIVDGKGRVDKPCYAVSSFSFLKNNLTGLAVTESGEVTTTVSGNTLVEITYTTKYQEFVVNKGAYDKLQVYINGVKV